MSTDNIFRAVFTAVLLLLSYAGIFIAPLHVEHGAMVFSASYDYGSNNAVAILATWAMAGAAILLGRMGPASRRGGLVAPHIISSHTAEPASKSERNELFSHFFLLVAAQVAFVALVAGYIDSHNTFGEAAYFTNRTELLAKGARAYVDFEFAYGPALLFPIAWLVDLGIPAKTAYFCFYIFALLLGNFFVFITLLNFPLSRSARLTMLYALMIVAFPISLGLNYLHVRFFAPIFSLYILSRAANECIAAGDHGSFNTGCRKLHALVVGLDFLNLLLSPEIALAYSVSVAALLSFRSSRQSQKVIALLLHCGIVLLSVGIYYKIGSLATLFDFGQGGGNFPVLPGAMILFYLASIWVASAGLSQRLAKGGDPLYVSIYILGLCMVPGALGRCDFGHVFLYGMPMITLASLDLSRRYRKAPAAVYFGALLAITAGGLAAGAYINAGGIGRLLGTFYSQRTPEHEAATRSIRAALAQKPPLHAPFFNAEYQVLGIEELSNVSLGRYFGGVNVFTHSSFEVKYGEMESADRILLTRAYYESMKNLSEINMKEEVGQDVLGILLLYPFDIEWTRSSGYSFYKPLWSYLTENFAEEEVVGKFVVLARKGPAL